MIIVEGPDGAGKSTLVTALEEEFNMKREPRAVGADTVALLPTDEYVARELNRGFGRRLYDRFALISSPMYMMTPQPTFSGLMKDPQWLADRWQQFRQIRPVIIICLPPFETVRANLEGDPDNEVVLPHIEQIYHNYSNFAASYPFIDWVYDYTQGEQQLLDVQFLAKRWINRREKSWKM